MLDRRGEPLKSPSLLVGMPRFSVVTLVDGFAMMILRWLSAQVTGGRPRQEPGWTLSCGQAARQLSLADRLAQRGIFEHR